VALLAVAASVVSALEALSFWTAYRADLFLRPITRAAARLALVTSLTPVAVFAVSIPLAFAVHPLAGVATWLTSPLIIALESRYWPAW
jgi:hypothetical protein